MTVTFGEHSYEAVQVLQAQDMVDGTLRACLDVHLPAEGCNLDALYSLAADPANTAHIEVSSPSMNADASTVTQTFTDFSLLQKFGVEPVQAGFAADGTALTERRVVLRLAKKTVQEIQNEKILAALARLGIEI